MTTATGKTEKVHYGRNIKRFREMLGIKQEALALGLGKDWNQKKVSLLEAEEMVDSELLEQVAKVLKVPAEATRNLDDDSALNIIATAYNSYYNYLDTNVFSI